MHIILIQTFLLSKFISRYQEEKKDFETRFKELENNLKRKYERYFEYHFKQLNHSYFTSKINLKRQYKIAI